MKVPLFRSLRLQMPLLVVLGVIPPMLIAIFYASSQAAKVIREEAKENIALKTETLANAVSRWEEMNVLALRNLSKQPDILSMDAEKQKPVLETIVKTYEHLYLASTTDIKGMNIARSDEGELQDYSDRSWFQNASAGNSLTYQTLIGRTSKKPALCLSTPIRDPIEIQGVAMLCTNLTVLAEQVGAVRFGETGYAFIVDNEGRILAHPDAKITSGDELTDFSNYPPVQNILSGSEDKNFSFKDEEGVKWLYYGTRLDNGWGVFLLQQEAEVLKTERELRSLALYVAVFAALGVGGLTWFLADRLIHPLSDLTATASSIANGKLDQRAEINRQDELGILAKAFNQMAEKLETYFDELEDKVQERTAQLKKAKEIAEVANETKSQFLAKISHELRTPLNSILGYAKILERDRHLTSGSMSLKIIQQSGKHLLSLIEELLDFSKIEANKLELYPSQMNLFNFLEEVGAIIEVRAAEQKIPYQCLTEGNLPAVIEADEKRLRQVLLNLLSNAVKFTEKGEITLIVKLLNNFNDTNQVNIRFEVKDTGLGISKENSEKIFQPFEQVGEEETRAAGTGLGLTISRQLVELMGGKLQVRSQLDKGSSFWFDVIFPVIETGNQGEFQQKKVLKKVGYKGKRRTILVVDDKEENSLLLRDILEPLGFKIVIAENGQEALDIAYERRPDLMLLDLFMPVKTGFTVVKEMQQIPELKEIKVIILTASTLDIINKATKYIGCDTFMMKPIDEDKLLQLLVENLQLEWVMEEVGVKNTLVLE